MILNLSFNSLTTIPDFEEACPKLQTIFAKGNRWKSFPLQILKIYSRKYNNESIPQPGQELTARFSTPRFGQDDSFDIASFTRTGQVCRVNQENSFTSRVAMEFAEPLPFKPAEQPGNCQDRTKMLRTSVI